MQFGPYKQLDIGTETIRYIEAMLSADINNSIGMSLAIV